MTKPKTLYAAYAALIETVLDTLVADGVLPAGTSYANVTLEPPRDASHGDLATNAAMVLAKGAGTNPRALAEAITAKLAAHPAITSAEIAGPGFINLRLAPQAWLDELAAIAQLGADYGRSAVGGGSAPGLELPTTLVALAREGFTADALESRLRTLATPIVARIVDDRVALDTRTLSDDELPRVVALLTW